ncbi:41774_t:CDS:2 [Gigaspora margarita]|uniref:41774_t:CDS:1 n=1 Tax=Gigaspora margarita TaxID=4874 RepID=A0ABN7W2C9_GIGMA|nr:41774_t:CDS:2 [Gigaspora margarita]
MTKSQPLLTPEVEKQLSYPKYWERDSTLWGSVADWDLYFINEMPGSSCDVAHKTLASETETLLNHFSENSREWCKAKAIRKQLKQKISGNTITSAIWKEHQEAILRATVENKINENINKRKIEDVARNVTSATAKACYAPSGYEIPKRPRIDYKNLDRNVDDDNYEENIDLLDQSTSETSPMQSTSETSPMQSTSETSSIQSTSETSPMQSTSETSPMQSTSETSPMQSTNETSPIEDYLKKFEEAYLELDPNHMWLLKSGRKVEEVIYQFARNLPKESYLHSFIVNDIDVATKSLFLEEEWKEITTSVAKDKPKLENSLVNLLKKYTVDDVERLRDVLFEPFIPNGCKYDRKHHFDLDFINSSYRGILRLWEMEENPIIDSLLEGWYEMNMWSRVIDPAFDNLNIDLVRGEGMSHASSDRKNLTRTTNDRKKLGRKGDGVFRLCNDRLEFGAIETGRKWEGNSGTKYMTDSLKICKMLKDMLNQLAIECGMKEDLVRKLQVVGILNGANRIQVMTVDLPKGYITRIQRRKVYEIAGRLSKSKPLAFALKEILYAKSIIMQTFDIINKKDDVDLENFLDDSDDQDGYHTPPRTVISKTFVTPKKEGIKDVINEKEKK